MLNENVDGGTREQHRADHRNIHAQLNKVLDITKYGASTSANDNTAAIQSALDAAAAQHRYVHIPSGAFKTTGTLVFKGSACGIVCEPDAAIVHSGTGYALVFGNANWPTGGTFSRLLVDGLTIIGTSAGAGGIRSYAAVRSDMSRMVIKGYTAGIGLLFEDHGWINTVTKPIIGNCDVGIAVRTTAPSGTNAANATVISAGEISGNRIGVLVGTENQTQPNAPDLPLPTNGFTINNETVFGHNREWAVMFADGLGLNVLYCRFEDNGDKDAADTTGHIRVGNGAGSYPTLVSIIGNTIVTNDESGGRGIVVENVNNATMTGNYIHIDTPQPSVGIEVKAGEALKIEQNTFAANVDTPVSLP